MNIQETINQIWNDLWDQTFFYSRALLEQMAEDVELIVERKGSGAPQLIVGKEESNA